MHPISRKAFAKLLEAAEKAYSAGDLDDAARSLLSFRESRFPDYRNTRSAADRAEINADLRRAEAEGAISIDWDPRAPNQDVERIRTRDADALARMVAATPRWEYLREATEVLDGCRARPRVAEILALWRRGKSVRRMGPADARLLLDGCLTLDRLAASGGGDIPVRRFSTAVFKDSKYIEERLMPALDALTAARLEDAPQEETLLLQELGMNRFPQPLLISAPRNELALITGEAIRSSGRYLGIPPEELAEIRGMAPWLLTIENLTTFNEAAAQNRHAGGILLYTAGMPSPYLLGAYRRILQSLGAETRVLHWGDIDLGGVRIAGKLAGVVRQQQRSLDLWAVPTVDDAPSGRKTLNDSEVEEIQRICSEHGWEAASGFAAAARQAIEQEGQDLRLPA